MIESVDSRGKYNTKSSLGLAHGMISPQSHQKLNEIPGFPIKLELKDHNWSGYLRDLN